jgi:hypothetical protein
MNRYTNGKTNNVLYSERSWIFGPLFSYPALLNIAAVRNFEVMLRQTLNHFV